MEKKTKKLISLRLEEELLDEYKLKAKKNGITFTNFVDKSLRYYNKHIDNKDNEFNDKEPIIRETFDSLYKFIIDYAAIYILLFLLKISTVFLKPKVFSNKKIKEIINGFLDNSTNWLQDKLKTELKQIIVENKKITKEPLMPRDRNEILIATQDFTESRFLGGLTSAFIKAKIPKLNVKIIYNKGGYHENMWEILKGGIDICSSYTRQILECFELNYIERNTNEVISKINDDLLQHMVIYDNNSSRPPKFVCRFGFCNDWRIVVKKDFAERNNLNTISDLKNCKALKIAVEEDFAKRRYGLNLLFQPNYYNLDIQNCLITKHEKVYHFLDQEKVDIIDGFGTDIHINRPSSNYKELIDDKSLFKSYDAGLLLSGRLLSNHGYLEKKLSDLEGSIDNQEISQIIEEIDSTSHSNDFDYIEKMANEWLVEKKLI